MALAQAKQDATELRLAALTMPESQEWLSKARGADRRRMAASAASISGEITTSIGMWSRR